MTPKITVTLRDKAHPFAVADRLMRALSSSLASHMAALPERMASRISQYAPDEIKRALGDDAPPPFSPDDIARMMQLLGDDLGADTQKDIDGHTQGIFALGVHLAQEGDAILQSPNTAPSSSLRASVVDRAAYQWARLYTYHEIRTKQADQISSFLTRFLDGLQRGESPETTARSMAKEEGTRPEDWLTIARTESARVLQVGLNDESRRLGVEYLWVPSSPRCCPRCRELVDARLFRLADIEGATNYGKKQADWTAALPVHPNCLHFGIPASRRRIEEAHAHLGTEAFPPEGVRLA